MFDSSLQNKPAMLIHPDLSGEKFLWFFAGSFTLFLLCYGILPLYDPDFWWHLKTGEVMARNGGVLSSDPFSFTGDGVVSNREALILKGYWLWQIIAYGLYNLFGFNGIFLLNLLTVFALAGVVVQQMRRQRVHYALAALLLTSGFYLLRSLYLLERPQVVSFLLAAILLGLLARVRDGGQFGWTLPLVMIVWANLHGGFVVGDLILLCFAAGAVMEYRRDLPRLRHLLLWVALGIGASLLNPNGALVFGELFTFQNSTLMTGVSEYQSTWVKFQQGSWYVVILWLLIALYGVGIWSARRLYWPDLIVALFLAYFSVAYLRNVGFFAVAMLPAIGYYWHQGACRRQWQLPPLVSRLLLSLCTAFLLWSSYPLWQARQEIGPVHPLYPEKAITFLQESKLQGRMFNDYTYGGYLLWRLAPQIKIFIDGRGLEPKVFEDWQKIAEVSMAWVDGRREYEGLLDRYAIDYIIQPIYDNSGRVQPLMKNLLNKPEWAPIYLDTSVYILARLTPKNVETISTYRIDKNAFKTRLLLIYDTICQSPSRGVNCQVARAGMLLYLSRYEEAKAQVEAIMAIAPHHQSLPELQRELAFSRAQRLRQ
jgi:hypothetical protein